MLAESVDCGGNRPYLFGWFENGNKSVMLGRYCANTMRFIVDGDGTNIIIDANVTIQTDVWYNFTATKSGNDYKLYQNGVLVGEVTSDLQYSDVDANLIIGGCAEVYMENIHHGEMDNLRVWNRSLSQEEISSNM